MTPDLSYDYYVRKKEEKKGEENSKMGWEKVYTCSKFSPVGMWLTLDAGGVAS